MTGKIDSNIHLPPHVLLLLTRKGGANLRAGYGRKDFWERA